VSALIVAGGDPSKVNVGGYAKGDVLAASAAGTLTALNVGPNTQVLTASSVATLGVNWAAGGGGGIPVPFVLTPVALVDAATIVTNAALGNAFRVTLTANRIMGAPTNPSDGQMVMYEIKQDGAGNHTLTLALGAGAFAFGTDLTSITLSTTPGAVDLIGVRYNATNNRWWVIAFLRGF
jgi:hypothetical protein